MKIIILLALVIATVALAGDYSSTGPTAVGRYNIIRARLDYVDIDNPQRGTAVNLNTVIRVDTTTGQAWQLAVLVNSTNGTFNWIPIPQPK